MRYLALGELLVLHDRLIQQWGGAPGIRDLEDIESGAAQPRMTFGVAELYPDLPTRAVALTFSLIQNHPVVDGNKRIGHAAFEIMLVLNSCELRASVDDAEAEILGVASGERSREDLLAWIRRWIMPLSSREQPET